MRLTVIRVLMYRSFVIAIALASNDVSADPKGIAITVGLNKVSPAHYAGWEGELFACENDARDMANIAVPNGFTNTTLLTTEATRAKLIASLKQASQSLHSGDIFMISYSGHGGQVFDENSDEKSNGPNDALDETWCLFDGQLIDDELYAAFRDFAPGVRVLVFSDSCHSGTVAREHIYESYYVDPSPPPFRTRNALLDLDTFFVQFDKNPQLVVPSRDILTAPARNRAMPTDVIRRTWAANRAFYRTIGTDSRLGSASIQSRGDDGEINAAGLLLSGCQDNQLSKDGWLNGAFTGALKGVWDAGEASHLTTYRRFHGAIVDRFSTDPSQTPNYYVFGATSAAFESQRPFTVK